MAKDQSPSQGPSSGSQAGSSGASGAGQGASSKTNQQANANSPENDFGGPDNDWDFTTHKVQPNRLGSDFWSNPRAPLSPIPEEHEPTSPAKGQDTPVQRLEQSLQNLSSMLKNHGRASDDRDPDDSSFSSPSSSSSYETDHSFAHTNDGIKLPPRKRVSNAGSSGSPTASSPDSPNSPKSILRRIKRGKVRRSIRHYTRGVERLQFNRYIYDLFRGTLSAKPKSRRSPKSKASSSPGSSSSAPSSATSGQAQSHKQQTASGAQSVASSADPAVATSSQPQQPQAKSNQPTGGGQAKAKAPPNGRGEISKISRHSMQVLNTIVKDLIIRFAHETNHLLADSRFVKLREPEALDAIKLILSHRQNLYSQVVQQYRQLAPSIKSSSGSSSSSGGGTAGGTPPTPKSNRRHGTSGRKGKGAKVSTANQAPSAPPSRYGPGTSPVAGSSGTSRD